jgi:HD superfamily phosphodiesterase
VAARFIGSAEFAGKYGAESSDAQYVQALYANVLHRAADAGGVDFWMHTLQLTSRAQVLVDFSQSAENRGQVLGAIQHGIGYAQTLAGTAGNDALAASSGGLLDGREGVDTVVFDGQRAAYSVTPDGTNCAVLDTRNAGETLLANVERLQFSDQTVALDIDGNAGEAYRLYQAAFGRTPDKAGLGFWIHAMDHGETLAEVASGFIGSAEFAAKYGADLGDAAYVDALYANVLHRAADAGGVDFWMHTLQLGSRAQLLVDFSESQENQAQVIAAIQDGIGYTP